MKESLRGSLVTFAAIVFVHAILSIYYWLTDWSFAALLRPSWESFGLVMVLVTWSFVYGRTPRLDVGLRIGLTALMLLFFLLGIGQTFASHEFGYDVILVLHAPFVPVLVGMMYNSEPLGMFIFYMSIIVLGLAAAILGSYVAMGRVARYCAAGHRRRGVVFGLMGVYMLAAGLPLGVNAPLTKEFVHQVDMAVNFDARIQSTAQQISVETAALRRFNPFKALDHKPNIFIFIVESYGEILFEDPDFKRFRDRLIPRLEQESASQGYTVRSRFMLSPVFGGSSWMADSSLLCGVKVHDQRRYHSLASSSVKCLPELLNDAGYYTVMGAANTTYMDEPLERLYPYDDFYHRDLFGYKGTRYGWSFMPDQYVINFVHENAVVPHAGTPTFASYMLTTSHHPWNKIPPYISDWSTIGDGSIYKTLRAKNYRNAFVSGSQFKAGFATSIEYSLDTIRQYLDLLPKDDTLIIILGDHQPREPVAFMKTSSWAVPVHVLSRDPDIVARFEQFGYVEGWAPDPERIDDVGIEQLLLQLLKVYSPPE
ncbi:sulfatase-like hydrolase/transferase [Haliangium sp.]|uniref:sulfatase-like hydrolase/transferase n=1 Tax=Haliangium sp. TaxID=2663208 RepID=UPI003D0FCD97